MIKDYIRKVHYHETDKMGITHHSNYVRWMEEARVDFLDQIGCSYARLEQEGIISPVIGIECQYKQSTTFDDTIRIRVEVAAYKGVRLRFAYTMTNDKTGALVCTAVSSHCFLNAQNRPIALKKQFPKLDEILKALIAEKTTDTP